MLEAWPGEQGRGQWEKKGDVYNTFKTKDLRKIMKLPFHYLFLLHYRHYLRSNSLIFKTKTWQCVKTFQKIIQGRKKRIYYFSAPSFDHQEPVFNTARHHS